MQEQIIGMDHGEGGAATSRLVREVFRMHLGGPPALEDGAEVEAGERVVLTTDTFVVKPLEFPGGDIGRLAVSGTVNDLAVMGSRPLYLTAGFVLEEGLELSLLHRILESMAGACREAEVALVAGDTKVVPRGEADGIYVNTSGLGVLPDGRHLSCTACRPGDHVLLSGPIADHGVAVVVAREGLGLLGDLKSDCQPLADLAEALLWAAPGTRCMRDPTRGGLATALREISEASGVGILIRERDVPTRQEVRSACDLMGIDPLYVACEGRLVAIVPPLQSDAALEALRAHPRGRGASRIGEVKNARAALVMETQAGGLRPLHELEGVQLPRIC
jgi:hydrogenase expression/formation protein HypE